MTPRITKILLWGIGIIVAFTVAAFAFIPDIEVTIPEKTVSNAIDDRIPANYGSDTGLRIQVKSADVDFLGDGDAGSVKLASEVKLSGYGLAGSGSAKTTTSVRYEYGTFYLSDLALDDFEVTPSLGTRLKLRAWKKALKVLLDDVAEEIRTTEGDAALAEFTEHRRTFGPFGLKALDEKLGTVPVYRLKGGPAQYAILLVLKDIRFTADEAIATLSPAQAILTISTGLILTLIGVLLGWSWINKRRSKVHVSH